jgi:hypothetical protein
MAACRASSSTRSPGSWRPRLAIHSSPSRFAARLRSSTTPHGQRRRTEPGLVVSRGDIFWIEADKTRGAVAGAPHPHVFVREDVFNHSRIGPSSSAH